MLTLRVAVDFGTSSTCTAVSVDGGEAQVVVVDGSPVMSSAVFAAADGELFVGKEAERQAAIDPARYEPHPKRRIDERELLLGSSVVEVLDVVQAVLRRAVGEARRLATDAEIDLLVLTHPANWGAVRSRVLRQAGHELANEVALVPEPVAAAVFHAAGKALSDGDSLAVLDLGGGTVDVSVVRRQGASRAEGGSASRDRLVGFDVLSTKGDPNFGGADIDQLLLGHIGSLVTAQDQQSWRKLVEGRELPDRRRRRVLAEDVRGAKESLSRHTYTDVPMPPPFPDAHVTRTDLERLVAAPLGRTVDLTVNAITEAGLRTTELTGVFLVGGSSRIPMVARLVHERTGIVPTTLDQPETVVARGALRALAGQQQTSSGQQVSGQAGRRPPGVEEPTVHISHPGRPRPPAGPPGRAPFPNSGALPQQQRPRSGPPGAAGGFPRSGVAGAGPGGPKPAAANPVGAPPTGQNPSRQPSGQGAANPQHHRRRILIGAAVGAVALAGVLVFLLTRGGDEQPGGQRKTTQPGKQVAQYDYEFTLPQDWAQTGGNSDKRQVLIGPENDSAGVDMIGVQEFELTVNTDTDRQTAVNKLRENLGPNGYTGFAPDTDYGGKKVVYYRTTEGATMVDWYVLFSGRIQVSTGCQFTEDGKQRVARACEGVVRSLAITR